MNRLSGMRATVFFSGGGMIHQVFFYAGGFFVFFWGLAHLFPTKAVVRGFGEISPDNKRIIAMEWIVEGAALIFIGVLIALATVIDHTAAVARGVYWLCFVMLNALSLISLFTGFKVHFLPFKLCPVIFTAAAILLLLGLLA
jgi:hypothetical protein